MRLGRRAPALAAAVLALGAATARAEPLDVELVRLGPPQARVWRALSPSLTDAQATALADDARRRFAILSSEVALAVSSPLLQPASTTGHSGFDVALEGGYAVVHDAIVGDQALGFYARPWPTRITPNSLETSGIHFRKGLPFSFELGGRLTYLARTTYVAAQGEAKWALNEGFESYPDVAVRVAYTRLFGNREWNLDTTDLDLLVSKRWGVSAVTSFTPYLAARFTLVSASSSMLQFAPIPAAAAPATQPVSTMSSFPHLGETLYRTTLGVRMTANTVSLALEGTLFAGAKHGATASYPEFDLRSALSAALRLGWEF